MGCLLGPHMVLAGAFRPSVAVCIQDVRTCQA